MTNKIIVKKFDILWELPKGDTDMEWANAVGKTVPVDFIDLLHKLFIKNKTTTTKKSLSGNCNKTRYACTSKESNKKENWFKNQRIEKEHYLLFVMICWIKNQLVASEALEQNIRFTPGVDGAQRTIPNSEAGRCKSLSPLRSDPAIPTRGISNHNQLEPRYKQVAEFIYPGGTSLWFYWWPQPGSPKLKVSPHRSGKGSSTVKDKVITENKSSHCKGDRLQSKPFHFPSASVFPIHPDAQSPHPETNIDSSLPSQIPCWIHRLAPLPHFPQIQPSHHLHCRDLSLSQGKSQLWEGGNTSFGELKTINVVLALKEEGRRVGKKLERWGGTRV